MKKRFLALLALFALLLSGCARPLSPASLGQEPVFPPETEETETRPAPEGFAVGFGRADITPKYSVPLQGYGTVERRMSDRVLDKLYATCVAFSDGETRLLCYTIDIATIPERLQTATRATVAKKLGVPEESLSFTATHTHSAPAVFHEAAGGYYSDFLKGLFAAGQDALADLDEAEMSFGTVPTEGLNFVRRYLLADGTYSQNNSGVYPSPVTAHETEADPEMRILYIKRAHSKDVILANWQVHPTLTGAESRTDVSADLVGAFRGETEKGLDVHFAYFQGAAGNLNPKSLIQGETRASDHKTHGKLLFEALKEGLERLSPVAGGKIRLLHRTFTGTINHSEETPERMAQAQEVADALKFSSDQARVVADKYGFANYFSATSLLAHAKMGQTQDMELYAFAIGDLAVATNPYEMFDTNGMALRAASPFAATMNWGYSNGHFGYIPSAAGYEHRGYEGTTSRFVPGTGEEIVAVLTQMLTELKEAE